MNYFAVLSRAMEANIGQLCAQRGITRAELCASIRGHLERMQAEYYQGRPNVPYRDPVCRLAYLYCHVAMGADLCDHAIRLTGALSQHLRRIALEEGRIRVCAFGGGPGTEQLALCNWLETAAEIGAPVRVTCCVIDYVAEWADSQRAIGDAIESHFRETRGGDFRNWPATAESLSFPVDIRQTENFANLPGLFAGHDLYILNYVVSELSGQEDAFSRALGCIAPAAPAGAFFLFVDRAEARIERVVAEVAAECGLEDVQRVDLTTHVMSGTHQKESLGALLRDVDWRPRTRSQTFAHAFRRVGE